MRNKIITILFALLVIAGVASHIAVKDKTFLENEKRLCQKLPAFSWENIRTGKFSDETEKYLTDQFPLRNEWVTLKTLAEKMSGKKECGGVYFADDGYLIEVLTGFDTEQMTENLSALKTLQQKMNEKNIGFYAMLVPTAGEILSDKLPKYAPYADQKQVIEQAIKLGINITDVTGTLTEHRDEYIFYRTDHHWTSLGAYYAYAEWTADKGTTPEPISAWNKETLCEDFCGTTYSKINYPFVKKDTIDAYFKRDSYDVNYNDGAYLTDKIYERRFLEGADKYGVFFNSNQSETVIRGGGSGKCLIIKDSYANCFAQFCIDDYEETYMIDMRFFRGNVSEYIEKNGITEVLVLYNIPNFAADEKFARCTE